MFAEIRRYFDLNETENSGYKKIDVTNAEKRLGYRLPAVLRKYYLELGRHEMNHTQDSLISPDRLAIEGDHLVFFTENQCVVIWSIRIDDINQDDPPVYGQTGGNLWCKASPTTSLFLRTMLHHQAAIFHFSDFVLIGQIEPKVVRFVRKHFAATEENLVGWLPSFYGDSDDLAIQLWEADSGTTLMLAGKTRQRFLDLLEIFRPLKFQWDMMPQWMTLENAAK